MKRRGLFGSIIAAGLLFTMTMSAGAQTLPGSGWYTTTTIQNIGTSQASINLEVYPQGSGSPSTASFNLDQNANRVFVPGGNNASGTVDVSPSLGSGFNGSAVVSSNQPIVAIGSIQNNQVSSFPGLGTSGGYANEFFRGASTSATTLIYPAVKNNFAGKTTIFSIQAAGSDVTVNATIRSNSGATHTRSNIAIPANRAINLIPSDFSPAMPSTNCGSDVNTSPCFGSLTVTATGGGIAGTYVEYVVGQSPATLVQSASLFPSTEAASTIYCPAIKNTYTSAQRRSTGMTVANTSNQAVTVNVSFTVSAGANAGQTYNQNGVSIPANGSVVFSVFSNNLGGMPSNNLASATVTTVDGSNSIVGVVNEQNFGAPAGTPVKATTYTCFNSTSATTRIAAPLVKKNLAGSTSGPTVQNVSNSTFTVSADYVCNTGNFTLTSPSLSPGGSYTFFNPTQLPNNSLCAVTLTGTGNIVAIVQETSDFAPTTTQRLLNTKNYEGFNL